MPGSKKLGPPRTIPGRPARRLSPAEFYELTAIRAPAEEMLGEDFGLAVKEMDSVGKNGICLEEQTFTHPEFDLVLSNPDARRRYLVKYDVVAFARGALDNVLVYEVDEHGCLEFKLEAVNETCAGDLMSPERVLTLRRQRYATLLATRDRAEQELMTLRQGAAARERLLDDRAAQAGSRARDVSPVAVDSAEQGRGERADGSGRASTLDVLKAAGPGPVSPRTPSRPDASGTVGHSDAPTTRRRSTRDLLRGDAPQDENQEP